MMPQGIWKLSALSSWHPIIDTSPLLGEAFVKAGRASPAAEVVEIPDQIFGSLRHGHIQLGGISDRYLQFETVQTAPVHYQVGADAVVQHTKYTKSDKLKGIVIKKILD